MPLPAASQAWALETGSAEAMVHHAPVSGMRRLSLKRGWAGGSPYLECLKAP